MNQPLKKITPEQIKAQWQHIMSFVPQDHQVTADLSGKRLLILGGSYLQVPAVLEAKALGLVTAVLDYNPACQARPLADRFYLESTFDKEAVLRCAQDFKADGIITLGTDWPMRSLAYACETLNLPAISYKTACRSTNKLDMIQELEKKGVAHPDYLYFDSLKQSPREIKPHIFLPCIIKPVDGSGSRGVILLRDLNDFEFALNYSVTHSKNGQVVIEEYMEGPEVSVEVIILGGIPHVLTITDKVTTGYPHFVETRHTQPSRLTPSQQAAIVKLTKDACLALELNHGAAHVEIIHTKTGPKIVEVGPRMGGDFIATHLVSLSTGVNMTQLLILAAMGQTPKLPRILSSGACIDYLNRGQGTFLGVDNLDAVEEMPGIVQAGFFLDPGTTVNDLHSSTDRLGYIIARGDSANQAEQNALAANQSLIIRMEK